MLRTAAIDQLTDTTPKIAGLMDRLEAAGRAARSVFTKEDVDRIVENRLLRERKKRWVLQQERDELEDELQTLRAREGDEDRS
jgi:hypothetical protein